MTPDDAPPFKIPTLEEAVEEILKEEEEDADVSSPGTRQGGGGGGHVTTSFCVPLSSNTSSVGSREFPAYDCPSILHANASAVSGYFWIDPNLGCSADAVHVFCNFTTNQTCLFTENQVSFNL